MQFIDLAAQQQRIRSAIDARVKAVLDHGIYIMGPEICELEKELRAFSGSGHCVSCASGTDALLMVLMAWGIGKNDAVFVPAFTFFATAEAVAMLGATPVIVDIDPVTFNMSPEGLRKAIAAVNARDSSLYPLPCEGRTQQLIPRAVIPVDLFGQAAEYDALLAVAAEYGLRVMEDSAQAFGGEYKGKKNCALGCHAAIASFFPAKPLGCYGDGGAVFTEDPDLAELLCSIRVHGKGIDKYDNIRIGINGRLDTLQAAILLAKLDIFAEEIALRQEKASLYAERMGSIVGVRLPEVLPHNRSVWAQYCIRLPEEKRAAVIAHLKTQGIPYSIYYPKPVHMLGAFAPLEYAEEDFPHALAASRSVLALPFHPYLTEEDAARVASAVKEGLHA